MSEEQNVQPSTTVVPEPVLDFLSSFDNFSFVKAFLSAHGLPKEGRTALLSYQDKAVRNDASLQDLPSFLKGIGVPEEILTASACEFAANSFLPISEWIPIDVKAQLSAWGADLSKYEGIKPFEVEKIPEPPKPPEPTPIHQTLAAKGAVFSDPIMQHRLELILASHHDGVRTKEQAMAVLVRSVKTGGLEMNEIEAGKVLGMVPVAPPVVIEKPAEPVATPEVAGAKADHFSEADAAEVAKIAETKKAAMETPMLITDTKAASDRIVAEANLVFPSGEVRTRFDHIIDARLRDVRDGFGTREKMEASVESGGVGMSGASLVAAMEMVENMDAMHHLALGAKTDFLKEKIVAEKAERAEMAEKQTAQEAQVMSQRYAEITGKAPDAHVEPSTSARTSMAIPAAQATEQRAQSIDTSKVKAAIEATKAAGPVVTPVMSAATIPTTASGRPIVEDIRFERKLAGPVEELRMLTLSDFRRLSSDPKQAILRIRDKVELAAQEGYEHRIAAIKAWRESPLSQMYVAVSREALMAGKSIVDALADKRSRGEEVLKDEELHAIVELNGILRF
ncbi:MAG: hypothetical protein WCO25_05490 [Candidatus Uhrbacteria bacterium]